MVNLLIIFVNPTRFPVGENCPNSNWPISLFGNRREGRHGGTTLVQILWGNTPEILNLEPPPFGGAVWPLCYYLVRHHLCIKSIFETNTDSLLSLSAVFCQSFPCVVHMVGWIHGDSQNVYSQAPLLRSWVSHGQFEAFSLSIVDVPLSVISFYM